MKDRSKENYNNYYTKIERIGRGGFGEVWKAELKSDNPEKEIYALKFIDLKDIRQKVGQNLEMEEDPE